MLRFVYHLLLSALDVQRGAGRVLFHVPGWLQQFS